MFGASDRPGERCIGGISLSGLLALYAPYACAAFGAFFSISGSNWYEGLLDFLESHAPHHCRAFLSYGRAEGRSRFSMQKDAGECTEAVCAVLRSRLGESAVTLYTDGGKHHNKRVSRFTAALLWFCEIR